MVRMLKSPVSILQELMTQRKLPAPIYTYEDSENTYFSCVTCYVDIGVRRTSGTGSSRKAAKHNAAVTTLEYFGIRTQDSNELASICVLPTPSPKHIPTINFIGKLNEFSSGHKLPHAIYIHKEVLYNLQFCVTCHFLEFTVQGFGRAKKTAKQDAAKKMLRVIQQNGIGLVDKPLDICENMPSVPPPSESAIQELDEALQKYADIVKAMKTGLGKNAMKVLEESQRKVIHFCTWKDLEIYLIEQGYTFEMTVFQKEPLILCVKVNEYTFLEFGETREKIYQKLLPILVNMLELGKDLRKPFITDLSP